MRGRSARSVWKTYHPGIGRQQRGRQRPDGSPEDQPKGRRDGGGPGPGTIDPVQGPGQAGSIAAEGSRAARGPGQRPGRVPEAGRRRAMTSESSGQELVVVGVDGSAESVRALGWAAPYAAATGARVQALLAWHYPAAAGQAPVGVPPAPTPSQPQRPQPS